jgi:hypothetical protein
MKAWPVRHLPVKQSLFETYAVSVDMPVRPSCVAP